METTTFTQSNYSVNYNTLQVSLPLDLGIKINSDNEVVSFLKAIEGVNLDKYFIKKDSRGRKGYNKVALLKTILFARMVGYNDLRSLESLCENDIRFMYIMDEEKPCFMTFERLIQEHLINTIDQIFFDITEQICLKLKVNKSIQYIDGTKIEANANKYTFVYKTRILNARVKLFSKITSAIIHMNFDRSFNFLYHYFYSAQEIGAIAQYLMEVMVNEDIEIVYGKGKRKTDIQRWYDLFLEYYVKLNEYEFWLHIIGENRNSCSKNDYDATMCATKMDYYCNTGLSRPCYNVQIAVSDGIIVNGNLYQRPADSKIFIPFMERYKEYTGEYPQHPMADAGYGSFDNYMYCITHGLELDMKYTMYAKKNSADFKKKKYISQNWKSNDCGYKVCPNRHVFEEYIGDQYDNSGKYLKIKQKYRSKESCKGCPYIEECLKYNKNKEKTISRDVVLEEFYETVDKNLSTEFGKELKKQRSIQVEGAFGVIKQDMKFNRFTRRGLKNAKMEFLIVSLGYNLKKYHLYRLRKEKEEREKVQVN